MSGAAEQAVQQSLETILLFFWRVFGRGFVITGGVISSVAAVASATSAKPGRGRAGVPANAVSMKDLNIRAGKPPPVARFMALELSLPIHTPVTRSAV